MGAKYLQSLALAFVAFLACSLMTTVSDDWSKWFWFVLEVITGSCMGIPLSNLFYAYGQYRREIRFYEQQIQDEDDKYTAVVDVLGSTK